MSTNTTGFLVLPRDILSGIKRVVFRTSNETGVRLVGEAHGRTYVVRHIIGPGQHAIESSTLYQCDNEYAEEIFNRLLKRQPHLRFLGELHTHPGDVKELSSLDLATIRNVLCELPFFIAGIIQRRPFRISPVLFKRTGSTRLNCVLR